MTSNEILKADVLDIVFDNRNKNYGAYLLRKYYNNRLLIALGGMLGFVVVLVIVVNLHPQVAQVFKDTMEKTKATVVVLPPTEPPPPPPVEPPAQRLRQVRSTSSVVIADVTDVKTQDELKNAIASINDVEGVDVEPGLPTVAQTTYTPQLPAAENPLPPPPAPPTQASFPGGQEAWMRFLSRYLQTPSELQAGEKKSVIVRFAVDEEGVVSRFEIIQSGGASFDNEVIRVLKKMPKWKAAVQNGRHVSVMFTQPVTFVAVEE